MKKLFALLLTFVGLSAMAQSKFNVSGSILEQGTSEALISASVKVLSLPDSTMVAGDATGLDGSFNIKGVKKGKYVVQISYVGFVTKLVPLDLTNKKDKDVTIGYIHLSQDTKLLKDAVVTTNVAKVEVSGDSIVFNAAAYRVAEGSVLEDLVKKLPGAKVDENGTVTINGKTVKKILVDGKEFFFDDSQMAMKNIPTDMIDKIKTYDRKSDYARVTGIDDGEEETVLDLTVKKGMNNGWFGNFNGAYGTEKRYSANFMMNRFDESNQYTLTGRANNNGDMGFGGMGGRGFGMGMGGLRSSKELGLNFATETGKLEAGGSVRFRYNGSDNSSQSATENFMSETVRSFSNSSNANKSSANNWNAQARLEWTPDSVTNIIFRPNGSLSTNKGYSDSRSASFNDDPYSKTEDPLDEAFENSIAQDFLDMIVNTNISRQQTYSENRSLGGNLQANRRLNDYGRNITLNLSGNFSDSKSKQLSASKIDYMQNTSPTQNQNNNRYYTTPGENRSFSAQISYSEPIANRTYLQFSYRYNYSYSLSDRQAFVLSPTDFTDLNYALLNNRYNVQGAVDYLLANGNRFFGEDESEEANKLSQRSENNNYNHTASISFRKITDYYNFNIGVDFMPQRNVLDYKYMGRQYDPITRNVFNWAPSVDFRYNFNQQTNLRFNYRARTQQPSMTNLLDITDDSNPLNITKGNKNLDPSVSHNISLNYNTFTLEHQQSIFAMGNVSFTRNSISNKTSYDPTTGQRVTRPENINGNWNGMIGGGFNRSLDRYDYFTMNSFTNVNFNHQVGYTSTGSFVGGSNYDDLLNASKRTSTNTFGINENLGFDFRKDWFEMGINGSVNYNKSKNGSISTGNTETWTFTYGADLNLIFDNGLSISTDISQMSRRGFASSEMNTNELLWNAQIAKSFLRGNALTISFQWNDILRNQSNISRQISAYQRSDSRTNAIYSYGMVHIIYKLNIFGKGGGMGGFGGGMGGFGGGMGGFGGGMGGFGGGMGGGRR